MKYHKNSNMLQKQNKLLLIGDQFNIDDDDHINDYGESKVTLDNIKNAINGLYNVPIEEIYLFLLDQINSFKKTWYYYFLKIKNEKYLTVFNPDDSIPDEIIASIDTDIYITPKNIYNYAKSMIHVKYGQDKEDPYLCVNHWMSLHNIYEKIYPRMLDIPLGDEPWIPVNIDDKQKNLSWFNISSHIERFYSDVERSNYYKINYVMHCLIRAQLIDIIFESLIYHGLLTDYVPVPEITDTHFVESSIGSKDDMLKTSFKRKKIKEIHFNDKK